MLNNIKILKNIPFMYISDKQISKIINKNINQMINEVHYAFHCGKDHNFKPYKSENKFVCQHETGQFGSGTYFASYDGKNPYEGFSDTLAQDYGRGFRDGESNFIKIKDGIYRVDFDIYRNLYRVYTDKQGNILHSMMSYLNSFYQISTETMNHGEFIKPERATFYYQIIKNNAESLGLQCPSYLKLYNLAKEHRKHDERIQSFATVFMELNGFNGVNVSGVPKFDNTRHGSVIYDLSKVSDKIIELNPSFSDFNTYDGSHTNTVSIRGGILSPNSDKNQATLHSLTGRFSLYYYQQLDDKEKMRYIKNLIQSSREYLDTDILYFIKKDNNPKIIKYILNKMYDGTIDERFTLDYDVMNFIVKEGAEYFVNYKVKSYSNRFKSFLLDFYYDYARHHDEGKIEYLNHLLSLITRELTTSEKSAIEDIKNGND